MVSSQLLPAFPMLHVYFKVKTKHMEEYPGDGVYASMPQFEPSWSKSLDCARLGEEGETPPSQLLNSLFIHVRK